MLEPNVKRAWLDLWTWLCISLYGVMALTLHALHHHQCGCCGSNTCAVAVEPDRHPAAEPSSAEPEESRHEHRPAAPFDENCAACRFYSQPKSLSVVVAPPEICAATEVASSELRECYVSPAGGVPLARGPPAV